MIKRTDVRKPQNTLFGMALDVHRLDNNEYLFGLDDKQYSSLSQIFETFRQRTGLEIDPYKDMKLTTENVQALICIIDNYIQQTDLNANKQKTTVILEFKGLLKYFSEKNIDFQLRGD